MIARLRALSPRGEKTVRLVSASAVGAGLGIPAVVLDSPGLGYAAVAVPLVAILLGPLAERAHRASE